MIRQLVALPVLMTRAKALELVHTASRFEAQLMLESGPRLVNAKSVLGVLSLASAKERSAYLLANGPDETEAAATVAALLAQ